jgi:hypothetical protein
MPIEEREQQFNDDADLPDFREADEAVLASPKPTQTMQSLLDQNEK